MSEWKTMDSVPTDGTYHARGLWVRHMIPDVWTWEVYAGRTTESGSFVDSFGEGFGWESEDYEAWHELAEPPSQ